MDQRQVRTRPTQLRRWPTFGAALAVLGWALWTGCSGTTSTQAAALSPDGGSPAQGGPFDASTASNDASGDVAPVTADVAVDAPSADARTASPVISDLMVVANPNCVLSATITFTTNVPNELRSRHEHGRRGRG
jgi:hypothetical protein